MTWNVSMGIYAIRAGRAGARPRGSRSTSLTWCVHALERGLAVGAPSTTGSGWTSGGTRTTSRRSRCGRAARGWPRSRTASVDRSVPRSDLGARMEVISTGPGGVRRSNCPAGRSSPVCSITSRFADGLARASCSGVASEQNSPSCRSAEKPASRSLGRLLLGAVCRQRWRPVRARTRVRARAGTRQGQRVPRLRRQHRSVERTREPDHPAIRPYPRDRGRSSAFMLLAKIAA